MIVGIMADTHDRLPLVDKAVKVLNEKNVELVLHAGDYIAPFVIPHFEPLKARFIGVFGNNDGEKNGLQKKFEGLNAEVHGNFADVTVDGVKIALLHGSEEELLQSLINVESHDIIIYGHTHQAKTYRKGKTLIINPGEVCGYLTEKSTIALLNLQTKETEIIEL
ncbi:MAG: metallophosphoesterase [Candidatus Bathyarchaeota archaeon]|jgi:putative phosphoesterase|nr:metallophosphoesterase [Candidatus Bathyarchaeota archaeon]